MKVRLPPLMYTVLLLCAYRARPRCYSTSGEGDELAASHLLPSGLGWNVPGSAVHLICYSMTSSAVASKAGGTLRPSALAVLRLISSSYLLGVCTGRSAALSPLRMRS